VVVVAALVVVVVGRAVVVVGATVVVVVGRVVVGATVVLLTGALLRNTSPGGLGATDVVGDDVGTGRDVVVVVGRW
jgi:hypothetical protein